MKAIDKLKILMMQTGLNQKEFAEKLGINHIVFNRNLQSEKFTAEMMKGIINNFDVDLNWLFKNENVVLTENTIADKKENSINEIEKAITILNKLKIDLTRE